MLATLDQMLPIRYFCCLAICYAFGDISSGCQQEPETHAQYYLFVTEKALETSKDEITSYSLGGGEYHGAIRLELNGCPIGKLTNGGHAICLTPYLQTGNNQLRVLPDA